MTIVPWAEAEEMGVLETLNLNGEESIKDEVRTVLSGGEWPEGCTDEDVTVELIKGQPEGAFDVFTSDEFMDLPGLDVFDSGLDIEDRADLVFEVGCETGQWSLVVYGVKKQ